MLRPFPARFPVLGADGLWLDEPMVADAAALHGYLALAEVYEQTSAEPWTRESVESFIRGSREGFATGTWVRWAIRPGPGETPIGTVGFFNLDRAHARVELGYDLNPSAQGHGVMTRAARLAIGWAFDELEAERIDATVLEGNRRSLAVLGRLRFREEGLLRDYKSVRGTRRNFVVLGLLRSEWRDAAGGH